MTTKMISVHGMDADLWARAKARASLQHTSLQAVIAKLVQEWVERPVDGKDAA